MRVGSIDDLDEISVSALKSVDMIRILIKILILQYESPTIVRVIFNHHWYPFI